MSLTGDFLKRQRLNAGLTQKRLAAIAGISQAHVAKIESGKVDPRLSTVNRILCVLRTGERRRCFDIMTKAVIFAHLGESVLRASETMIRNAVSQLPVLEGNRVVGTITEQSIIRNLRSDVANAKVKQVMDPPLPQVQEDMCIDNVQRILEKSPGLLVMKGRSIVGILTRSDLLKTIS